MVNHPNRAFSREAIFSSLEELKTHLEEYEDKIRALYPDSTHTVFVHTSPADFDLQESTDFISKLILQGKIRLEEVPQSIRFNEILYRCSFMVSRDILLSKHWKNYSNDSYINTIKLFFDDLCHTIQNDHPKRIIYSHNLPNTVCVLLNCISLDVLWRNYAFKDFIKSDWQEAIQRVYKQLGRGGKRNYEKC